MSVAWRLLCTWCRCWLATTGPASCKYTPPLVPQTEVCMSMRRLTFSRSSVLSMSTELHLAQKLRGEEALDREGEGGTECLRSKRQLLSLAQGRG